MPYEPSLSDHSETYQDMPSLAIDGNHDGDAHADDSSSEESIPQVSSRPILSSPPAARPSPRETQQSPPAGAAEYRFPRRHAAPSYNVRELGRKSLGMKLLGDTSSVGVISSGPNSHGKRPATHDVNVDRVKRRPPMHRRTVIEDSQELNEEESVLPRRSSGVDAYRHGGASVASLLSLDSTEKNPDEEPDSSPDTELDDFADELATEAVAASKEHLIRYKLAEVPSALTMATRDRPYGIWIEGGQFMKTCGVPLPQNYEKTSVPGFPWVCPIRDCKVLFNEIKLLGRHWTSLHKRRLYNDNCDGTLSLVGFYGDDAPNDKASVPGIVISQNRLARLEQGQPLEPNLRTNENVTEARRYLSRSYKVTRGTEGLPERAIEMWRSISQTLARGGYPPQQIHPSKQVRNLLILPGRRDLEWRHGFPAQFTINTTKDITSVLVQITGDMPPNPCTRCISEKGPYVGCFVISSETEVNGVTGCANCCYHGNQTDCSIKGWVYNRAVEAAVATSSKVKAGNKSTVSKTKKDYTTQDDSGKRHSGRVQNLEPVSYSLTRKRAAPSAELKDGIPQHTKPPATSLISAGWQDAESLRMETWEKAPGRIRSEASEKVSNIAFSKSYLAAGHEIQACPEAFFKVETVRSGELHKFKPRDNCTRLCSVASGKLTVRMDKEAPFIIGPHGMFKIEADVGCTVESDLYVDVILHVTSVMAN